MSRRHRDVMAVLIGDIMSDTLAEGDQLPREVDLAEQFHVSRGVVRECLRGLEERGLVRVTHGRGATVTPESEWDLFDPEVLSALLSSTRGHEAVAEYVECQRLLEVEAARLAALRATDKQITQLSDDVVAMAGAAERTRANAAAAPLYIEAEHAFHRTVFTAAGNRVLGRMAAPVHRVLATLPTPANDGDRLDQSVSEHERILAAIADRNPEEARTAMAAHLQRVGQPEVPGR